MNFAQTLLLFAMGLCPFQNAWCAGPVGGSSAQRMEAIAKAVPTAVMVFEPGGNGGGSGVLINAEGDALTNFHVTSPAGSFMRCGLADGKIYDAVIVGIDPVGDLAMIRLIGDAPFPYSALADSDRVRVGDPCFAAGNPFLLATNLEPSVSWGIVSGTHRYQFPSGTLLEYADCLQTDAAINPGNSGGALFSASAEVIGIVGRCSFEKRGRINVGIGYAISSNQAKNFLGVLRSGRIVDHATLGATVTSGDSRRVRVSNILESSDAFRRGLRYGDEILSLDNREIHSANDLTNVLGTLPEGWRVPMVYRHEGVEVSTIVRLPGIHGPGELVKKMAGALPSADEPPQPKKRDKPKGADPNEPKPNLPEDKKSENDPHQEEGKTPFSARTMALHEERPEMANEFFNRTARERMIEGLKKTMPKGLSLDQGWLITGKSGALQGNPMEIRAEIGRDASHLIVGDQFDSTAPLNKLYEGINDKTLAGLQAALIVWEQLLRDGTKGSSDATYFGTCPLRGTRPLRDCLMLTIGELEVRVYTSIETGRLEGLEIQADPDTDPVELYPSWDQQEPAKLLGLELVYGTETRLVFEIDRLQPLASNASNSQTKRFDALQNVQQVAQTLKGRIRGQAP